MRKSFEGINIMKIEIYIATHKEYSFPAIPEYIPIHVGKKRSSDDFGIIGDDKGDNISELNESFCELTALYWIWKNSSAQIVGLVHYRRYLQGFNKGYCFKGKNILSRDDILEQVEPNTVIVVNPRWLRSGYKPFVSIKENFYSSHYRKDWELLKNLIATKYPEYYSAFEVVESRKRMSGANMMVCNKKIFDEYCSWLFGILFELSNQINFEEYDSYQKRVFGFLSERLLNVYLEKNRNFLNIRYAKLINLEDGRWYKRLY